MSLDQACAENCGTAGNALDKEFMFISADYRLLYPLNGFAQLEDAKALFRYLSDSFNAELAQRGHRIGLDISRVAVSGASGGAYIARFCALHARPRPAACILIYGMGGDMLSDFWLSPMETPMLPRKVVAPILDDPQAKTFSDLPIVTLRPGVTGDTERRIALFIWGIQNGCFTDFITGINGLSAKLQKLPYEKRFVAIPSELKILFPEFHSDKAHPPTFIIHGDSDAIILPSESIKSHERLKELGVYNELALLPGLGHGFDDPGSVQAVSSDSRRMEHSLLDFLVKVFEESHARANL